MVDDIDEEVGVAALGATHRNEHALEWLESIYQMHARAVLQTAYRVTGSAQDAEDVLQTVFIRLAGRATRPDFSAGALPYLRRAATNAGLDLLRSRKVRAASSLDAVPDLESDHPEAAPERLHHSRQLHDHLRRALAELNDRNAEMFALRYFEGLDNAQIAAQFDTSPGTVAVTLHRIRARLCEVMRPYLGGIQ